METKHPKANCLECTLKDKPYVPTYVPKIYQYKVLFVAQAAGDTEQYTQVPLTGPAGKQHYSLLKMKGLNKTLMAHTNICLCYPGKEIHGKGDKKPTLLEVKCCFERLKYEIQEIQPELIVALGDPAIPSLTRASGVMRNRGRFLDLLDKYEYPCKVLCTMHPSFVQRARQWIPIAANTYGLINDYFGEGIDEELDPEFILDPTPDVLREYLEDARIIYGTDTETTGLDPRADDMLGHSFSKDLITAVSVYYAGPDDPRLEVIKEFLEDPKKQKCWQNGSFDTGFTRENDIIDEGFVFDTRLAQQLLNSDLPSDLDFLRAQYTTIAPYKPPKAEMKQIAKWNRTKMLEYACWDAITTKVVMHKQQKLLSKAQVNLMQILLIPLVRVINYMEHEGVLVDVNALAGLYSMCAPRTDEINEEFSQLGINPRSPKQLIEFFDLKSSDKDHLQAQIKRDHPKSDLMELVLEYRDLYNMQSKYLLGIYKRLLNGRIHTHFKIEGTGTGRLSSEDPNLLNVPEEMRAIYIPDPGHIWVSGDYSQIELWTIAIIAKEDQMLKDLQDGVDIHYEMCKVCFPFVELIHGTRKEDFSHRQDLIAKTVVFGTAYGRSPWSIAREFGITVVEAQDWQMKCINKYPNLAAYKQRCENEFNRQGYLETPFGRKRYVTSVTQSYNFPIQSTASDITLQALVKTREATKAGLILKPRISVYDDILIQVPKAKTKFNQHLKRFKSVMERKVPELENMSFKVGYKKGINWCEMEEIK